MLREHRTLRGEQTQPTAPTPEQGASAPPDEPWRGAVSDVRYTDTRLPQISSELLERVSERDPQACVEFLTAVHQCAWQLVQDALEGRAGTQSARIRWLIQAYRRDELQIQAALLSAQTSFRRHFLDAFDPLQINDDKDYVTALIGLAYRHWQRREYRDKQTRRHAATGNPARASERISVLDQLAHPGPSPDHDVVVKDFYEKLVEEVHLFSRGLKEGEAEVIYLRLFQEMTYEQIGARVNKSVATVCRICQQAIVHLRKRFRDSMD